MFSRQAIRELDRRAIEDFAIPGIVLMENAGRGVADLARAMLAERAGPVAIVCGTGANGGDGLVAARHLANAGVELRILIAGDPESIAGDARTNLEIVRRMDLPITPIDDEPGVRAIERELSESALIIDALFGTGLDRPVAGFRADLIGAINRAGERGPAVLAVDLPSGMDADTGEAMGPCVRAAATATFVGHKRGFPTGEDRLGRVVVVDIGAPASLVRLLADPSR